MEAPCGTLDGDDADDVDIHIDGDADDIRTYPWHQYTCHPSHSSHPTRPDGDDADGDDVDDYVDGDADDIRTHP